MTKTKSTRIQSIDILRGLVMILMALDHVRDFFYYGSFLKDPTDLETTTPILFFTRFITHYCAPVFVFLAGTAAFLYGNNKRRPQLFKFLITRGIWLVILEITVNNLLWKFDITYSRLILQVIWVIGVSMIVLSILIFLTKKWLLFIGLLITFGHNLLDSIIMEGTDPSSIFWYILHQPNIIPLNESRDLGIFYPVLPWIGIMILGYCLGQLYVKNSNAISRKKWLLSLGTAATLMFFILRSINYYGDPVPWQHQDTLTKTILSFFKVTKYPPSLAYTLITIGPSLLFLYAIESVKNSITDFFLVFGRVPLFYYFLHIFVIHVLAIFGILIFGGDWQIMILSKDMFSNGKLLNYGYPLLTVYLIWLGVIALLYFPCKKYMIYKAENRNKWWLSYL
ncbi:DUF1624 domain-containing protein [Seonamhaeicola sediminis]|uniref:DUF1624 domain-containing protein n=1 Tax=Seonamhaeicola sediminis TaxID=2528206 RepID=A0A562YEE2_9FLAO|nr:heparan-alpha-glucosaminide N-acetyltransferase domain-containing protein [Seonamhaeicola sediminis]TWO32664.1 DUF1624 domain-containing protein [Seonamhaeicola sediminis]